MASEDEPVTYLFMLIGNVKLPEYKYEKELNETLSKLQREIQDGVSKKYKITIEVIDIFKNPVRSHGNSKNCEFDVDIPGDAIVKIQCQGDKFSAFTTWHLKDNLYLQKIENTIDAYSTVKIELDVLQNIQHLNYYLKKIVSLLNLQSRLDKDSYIFSGKWINTAIARRIIIGLSERYSSDVKICGENIKNTKFASDFFAQSTFGKKISTKFFFLGSNYDIGIYCYFLSEHPATMHECYAQNIELQWTANFNEKFVHVKYLHQREERLQQFFHPIQEKLEKYASNLESVEIPNVLPQDYKEFLMEMVEAKFKPITTAMFKGKRHVYMVFKKEQIMGVKDFLHKYITLNHPNSKKVWQSEPEMEQRAEETGGDNSILNTTSVKHQKVPENYKITENTVIGYFHRENETLSKFYQEKLASIKETASKYKGLYFMYEKNMIVVEGKHKTDITQFLDWLHMLYQEMLKTTVKKIEPVQVNPVAPNTASSNINPTTGQKSSNNNNSAVSHLLNSVFKHKRANTQIEVLKGDITKLKVDAIVNAANGKLKHGAGVARAIAVAAGEDLVRESDQTIASLGHDILPGDTCTTTGGKLQCRVVIHAVGPKRRDYNSLDECTEVLMRTFESCLNDAFGQQCSTVAIPAISSGIYGVPKDTVAYAASATITEYLDKNPECGITEIKMIDLDEEMLQLFVREFKKFVNKKRLESVK